MSTRYTWSRAFEHLSVNSEQGNFELHNMEVLTFSPHPSKILGIPTEKIWAGRAVTETLYSHNGFLPTVANNDVVTAGYYDEIKTFVRLVDGENVENLSSLESMLPTYALMDAFASKL